jgi:hypothetical protein
VTKFVTPTAALVLSPTESPDDAARLPDVFDAFVRVVSGLERNELAFRPADYGLLVRHPKDPDHPFLATPLLRDGRTWPGCVPGACQGRVTRQVVADYVAAKWVLRPREPGRGMRIPFTFVDTATHSTWSVVPAKAPLVDPVRELLQDDDERVLPVAVGVTGDWAAVFTPWENLDGLMGLKTPGDAWLARRTAHVLASSRYLWSTIEGWYDAGDCDRYRGHWHEPIAVTAYLGWPAYLIAAVGRTSRCPVCDRTTVQGRLFCGAIECNRTRAVERQRVSRGSDGPNRGR